MSITSRTKTGIEVTLIGSDYNEKPMVEVRLQHPTRGELSFSSNSYGSVKGNDGILGYVGGDRACITVPKKDFEAAMAEASAIGEREIQNIKDGLVAIHVRWREGEILSGWAPNTMREGELLRELGLAEYVAGWGTHVASNAVEALGAPLATDTDAFFSYSSAVHFTEPRMKKAREEREAKARERSAKFAEAVQTGRPVALRSWNEECNAPQEECSLDNVTEYAMPDGSTKITRQHTY